jgi:hypothetical protein
VRSVGSPDSRSVHDKLDEVVRLVEHARTMPMSSTVLVPRDDLLALLAELRGLLPQALAQASEVLDAREAVVEQGRRRAEQVVRDAERERDLLVSRTEVHREAQAAAARLLEETAERVAAMQVEVDDYVDGRLATFEITLHRTLDAVERGRAKLAGRSALDELSAPHDGPDAPLPQ